MIEVFGSKNCSRCTMVKNILTNKKIEFTYSLLEDLPQDEYDIKMEKAKEKNMMALPLIFKNNELIKIEEI